MRLIDSEIDFTSTASASVAAIAGIAAPHLVSKLRVVPGPSNSGVVTISGPNGNPLKKIAATGQDQFDWEVEGGRNLIPCDQIVVSGASGDAAFVSVAIG